MPRWLALDKDEFPWSEDPMLQYAALQFDAVWAMAHALDSAIKKVFSTCLSPCALLGAWRGTVRGSL